LENIIRYTIAVSS